ncbi:4'-phosphopantetheinyl transferase superfamily protein [Streptomyces sp. NBC_00247]|uniref:4'-phosphopantetheinyl transferase family protein n=1 Tax=Streptomyces sp. NBC_00247 TaxID=2975689 RepID=UPI002E2C08D3|nr:4'-phosphopantetheinyl transferase superfamily protein [Streptomyces sp. NBC_00247]
MTTTRATHDGGEGRTNDGATAPGGRRSAAEVLEELRRTGDIHVWGRRTGGTPDADDLALLDEAELRRVRDHHLPRDGAAFGRTRAFARRALGGLLDVRAQDISLGNRPCPACGAPRHGPPLLLRPPYPLAVSLSRTEGYGMLAVCADTSVGIDVEALRPVDAEGLADVVLTARERAHVLGVPDGPARAQRHLRCWTRKEAVVKAAGSGLLGADLTRLEVRPEDPGPVRIAFHDRGHVPTWWQVHDVPIDGPWIAAVARPAVAPERPGATYDAGAVVLHPPGPGA